MDKLFKSFEILGQSIFFACIQILADRMIFLQTKTIPATLIATLLITILFRIERQKIWRRWLFVIVTFLTGAVGLYLVITYCSYMFMFVIVMETCFSVYAYFVDTNKDPEAPGWFCAGLIVAVNVTADILHYDDITLLLYLLITLYLLMMMLYSNQKAITTYLKYRESTMQMDVKRIKRINNVLIAIAAGAGVIAAVISKFVSVQYIKAVFTVIVSALVKFCSLIVMIFDWWFSRDEEVVIPENLKMEIDEGGTSFLARFDFLIIILVLVIIAVILYYSIRALVKFLLQRRTGHTTRRELDGYVMIESVEWLGREKKKKSKKEKHKVAKGNSYSARIRRLYQKAMRPLEKKKPQTLRYASPKEQARELEKAGGKLPEECVSIYEKARYSESGASRDEYKNMKDH